MISSVAFTPNGQVLVTAVGDGRVVFWNVTDAALPRQIGPPLAAHDGSLRELALSADGHLMATAGYYADDPPPGDDDSDDDSDGDGGGGSPAVTLWDVTDPAKPAELSRVPNTQESISFANGGRSLLTSTDGQVILWDVQDPRNPRRVDDTFTAGSRVIALGVSREGRTLATGNADGTLVLWDVAGPAGPQRIGQPLAGHDGSVTAVGFSPDAAVVATSDSDGMTTLWDVSDTAAPNRINSAPAGLAGLATSIAFTPGRSDIRDGRGGHHRHVQGPSVGEPVERGRACAPASRRWSGRARRRGRGGPLGVLAGRGRLGGVATRGFGGAVACR